MKRTMECTFSFDVAHRILGLDIESERALHGHGLQLTVVLGGNKLDNYAMIIDRNYIIQTLNPLINKIDHSCILWKEDPITKDIISLAQKHNFENKIIIINNNPTVEGIADYLYREIQQMLTTSHDIKIILKASESLQVSVG